MKATIGIGVIGMGFMGQTHVRAYAAAAAAGWPCQLRAACDRDSARRAGEVSAVGNMASGQASKPDERLFDQAVVKGYASPDDLLADPDIDLVSICTHTDTHVDLAIRAIGEGKHVLVEKPVALKLSDVQRLQAVCSGSDRLCVPAMCVRFWPGWSELRGIIESGIYGRVVHARFERLGSPPAWAGDFYADASRSGGAVFDLHVHDADLALSLFGRPEAVSSVGDDRHISTQMHYQQGLAVTTEGGWLNDRSFPFRMAYTVEFERAVVAFDSSRTPVMSIHEGGAARVVDLPSETGYDCQARALVSALTGGGRGELSTILPTLADAVAVTRLIEAERESTRSRGPVRIRW